jgi:KaiC/GvpD/RAD55 family RecA-like ATPase
MSEIHVAINQVEERLLGTWTRRPGLRAAWTPEPQDFLTPRTQAVAAACKAVADLKGNDLGTAVVAALHAAGKLKLWEPGTPVVSHADEADPVAALDRWRELHSLERLYAGLSRVVLGITARAELGTVRGLVHEALRASEANAPVSAYSDEALMAVALEAATTRHVGGYATGFPQLDQVTGGIRPGHCWVLGAPTNWGKSSLLLAVLDQCQSTGRRALLVTCEDAPELLATRLLARRAHLPGGATRDGRLTADQLQRANDEILAARARGAAPILIDGRGRDVEHIAGDIRAAVRAHDVQICMVDYLQAISTSRESQDRRNEINFIARTLTDAVKTSDAAGLFASQLTGEDIRESRDVEHAAEVVLIGRKDESNAMKLLVKKNKTGPKDAIIDLDWNSLNGSFATAQPDPESDDEYANAFDRQDPDNRRGTDG